MKQKILFSLILILLAAIAAATLWNLKYGYVLITNGTWQADWSLGQASVILTVAFAVFSLLLWLLLRLWRLPKSHRQRRQLKRSERARRNIIQGLIELTEGHWYKAEQMLLKSVENSDTPLLNYLLAARAAQQQDADERRDQYLKRAHQLTPEADIAIGLTQAELQLAHGQTEQALATLTRLRELAPKHPYVIKLLSRLYAQLNEWEKLAALLPEIRKRRIVTGEKLSQLERNTYTQFIYYVARTSAVFSLEEQWKLLPKRYREDPELFRVYINCLIDAGHTQLAEKQLRNHLNRHWDESLVQLYGQINFPPSATHYLDYAESWLKDHGRSAMLLLTLARLCSRLRLWGKARVYYESSIAILPTVAAYAELGELLESLSELDSARECYRKGLALSKGSSKGRRRQDKISFSANTKIKAPDEPEKSSSTKLTAINN